MLFSLHTGTSAPVKLSGLMTTTVVASCPSSKKAGQSLPFSKLHRVVVIACRNTTLRTQSRRRIGTGPEYPETGLGRTTAGPQGRLWRSARSTDKHRACNLGLFRASSSAMGSSPASPLSPIPPERELLRPPWPLPCQEPRPPGIGLRTSSYISDLVDNDLFLHMGN
jgi:hypothetical protein